MEQPVKPWTAAERPARHPRSQEGDVTSGGWKVPDHAPKDLGASPGRAACGFRSGGVDRAAKAAGSAPGVGRRRSRSIGSASPAARCPRGRTGDHRRPSAEIGTGCGSRDAAGPALDDLHGVGGDPALESHPDVFPAAVWRAAGTIGPRRRRNSCDRRAGYTAIGRFTLRGGRAGRPPPPRTCPSSAAACSCCSATRGSCRPAAVHPAGPAPGRA